MGWVARRTKKIMRAVPNVRWVLFYSSETQQIAHLYFQISQVRNEMKYEKQQSLGGSGTNRTVTDMTVVVTK